MPDASSRPVPSREQRPADRRQPRRRCCAAALPDRRLAARRAGRSPRCSGPPGRRSRWFSSGCRSGWVISRAQARSPSAGWSGRSRLMAVLVAVTVSDSEPRAPGCSPSTRSRTRSSSRLSLVDVLRRGGKRREGRGAPSPRCSALALDRARQPPPPRTSTRRTSSSSRTGCRSTSARSTSRSTARSSTSSSAPRSRSCSGSRLMRWRLATVAGHAPDGRRGDLRHRPDPGCRDGPADEGDGALVPLLRHAADLHLRRQPARVHPAAVHRPDLPRRAGVGDLRGDVVDLGDARARAR